MTAFNAHAPTDSFRHDEIALLDLTFPSVRLAVSRFLVLFCFTWPFFNYALFYPDGTLEINFLPVFLAALLMPEVTLREKWSLLLAFPVLAVALIWATSTAPIRLAIAIIPLLFILNLTHHLRDLGHDLIPPDLAYRALQLFVGFCVMQTVDFQMFPIIPRWLTEALISVLPRYAGIPYDAFGIRGVQGWASEPSGAALTCIAFALVAIVQRPDRRWRVFALFLLLTSMNKSVYALVLSTLLGLGCLAMSGLKRYTFLAFVPMSLVGIFLVIRSSRITDLYTNLLVGGINSESNRELARFVQIFSPLKQFPLVYKPPILFGSIVMEPMGLLPLVAGYGSVFGLVWLAYILWRYFPPRHIPLQSLGLIAGFVLLMMTPPDLIPSIVALAAFSYSPKPATMSKGVPGER